MQLRHLRYFVKIVEAGSFSRAAALIHVAQPALSQQIAELEQELALTLLHRSARGVRPTEAGEMLYREAAAILRQIEQLPGKLRSAGGEPAGVVNLGMSSTLAAAFAGPFMDACRSALPRIGLRFITGHSLAIRARIEAGTLDLGVVFEDVPVPGVTRRELFRQQLFLVRRVPDPGTAGPVALAALAALPLVLPAQPNVTRSVLDRVFAQAGLVPNMVAETDTLFSTLAAVQSGIGATILPKGGLADVPGHETLAFVAIVPPVWLTATLLAPGEAPLTGAAEAVRDLFAAFAARRLAGDQPPGADWIGAPP